MPPSVAFAERQFISMDKKLIDKINKVIEHNPYSKALELELLDVKEGYAKARVQLKNELLNFHGNMHGGCSYTMGDILVGVASSAYGNYTTTINGYFSYLKPIANTEYVYGEAVEVRQGETIGVYDVKIVNDGNDVLATGVFTYYNTKIPINI